MSEKKVNLSGAATSVIHALFFRGALQDGDLPSKTGANELRELGFLETRHSATTFNGRDFFTFLTPTGFEYALHFLVETRFGVPRTPENEITIKIRFDMAPCLEQLDALKGAIEKSLKDTGLRQG